jgi:hypothetical protein
MHRPIRNIFRFPAVCRYDAVLHLEPLGSMKPEIKSRAKALFSQVCP